MLGNGTDDRIQQQKEQANSDNKGKGQTDEERSFSIERRFLRFRYRDAAATFLFQRWGPVYALR